jgi:hypothetical protein
MTPAKKTSSHNWRPFEEARAFVRSLGLKNKTEWATWATNAVRPDDIPATPSEVYNDKGWISWGDWLGTKNRRGGFRQFQEARKFARNLGLNSVAEWTAWIKSDARPHDIPADPAKAYKDNGWAGWRDWLASAPKSHKTRIYRSFDEARAYVHTLKFKGEAEWHEWSKTSVRPKDIPSNPQKTYRSEGWESWGDWLGTGFVAHSRRIHRPFEQARSFVHSLDLRNRDDWKLWAKSGARPADIPVNPMQVYENAGWSG